MLLVGTAAIGLAHAEAADTSALVPAAPAQMPTLDTGVGRTTGTLGASFISHCAFSHSLPDDPIVHPGVPGASHQHDFFANTTTSATST